MRLRSYPTAFHFDLPKEDFSVFCFIISWHERVEFSPSLSLSSSPIYKCICWCLLTLDLVYMVLHFHPLDGLINEKKKRKAPKEEVGRYLLDTCTEPWHRRERRRKWMGKLLAWAVFFIAKNEQRRNVYTCEMLMDKRTRERFTDSSVCFLLFFFLLASFYVEDTRQQRILNYLIM
jgi:hypothetical protein